MFNSCTKRYTDESDERTFRFTFYCDACGKPVISNPIGFTGACVDDAKTPASKELAEAMWRTEHKAAFGRADSEVREQLFRCPSCLEHVCSDCVRGYETSDGIILPRCRRCRDKAPRQATFSFVAN